MTYDEQNAQGDSSNAASIAGAFADDDGIDLILAVATPTAQAAVSAIGDKPILFAAVTDPVAAELVPSLEAEADELGIFVQRSAITNSSEVAVGVQALEGVDAIYVPTDNTVVSALEAVVDFAETTQTPLFVGEADSVVRGGIATRGLDYYEMGKQVGEMAVQILRDGIDVGTLPTLVVTDTEIIVNPDAAAAQGVTLSDEFLATAVLVDDYVASTTRDRQ